MGVLKSALGAKANTDRLATISDARGHGSAEPVKYQGTCFQTPRWVITLVDMEPAERKLGANANAEPMPGITSVVRGYGSAESVKYQRTCFQTPPNVSSDKPAELKLGANANAVPMPGITSEVRGYGSAESVKYQRTCFQTLPLVSSDKPAEHKNTQVAKNAPTPNERTTIVAALPPTLTLI